MNILVYGYGENIERQYANCVIQAMKQGLEVKGTYDNMPQLIERIRNRDIGMVLMDKEIREEYNEHDLAILTGTFARYGATAGIVE